MINDALSVLEASQGWKDIASAAAMNRCPQSVAVALPGIMQEMFVENYGRLMLGDSQIWKDGNHPDLIHAGKHLVPPSIDECRTLQGELALHPLVSDKRMAVIWCADKLSLEASNSLLKLTEEPPEHGCILFVSEEDKLIATIKSRVWAVRIELPEEIAQAKAHPVSDEEWADWIAAGKKKDPEILYLEIGNWVMDLAEKGNFRDAAELDSLVRLMGSKRLSVPMIQDLTYMVIKEGVRCEQIFSNLR
ncbi:MAG: hypothetical protein PHO18_04220 [Synergistaceae bacterium]|nr:hypothetical protein [Synergistaceae bacterium]